jgi:lysophospholipase L1-like esterase
MKSVVLALMLAVGSDMRPYAITDSAPCAGGLCQPAALAPYFDRLEQVAAGGAPPVHILQIGDSHSANDNFAGAWRAILQARFGDGGRGVMPPGRPWAGYATREVTVGQSAGWSFETTLQAVHDGRSDLFGLSGYRFTATAPGAQMTMTADPGHDFTHLVVCGASGPGGGSISISIGAERTTMDLHGLLRSAQCGEVNSDTPVTQASISAIEPGATVLSWATFRDGPGMIVSNLGVVGAELRHFVPNGDAAASAEMKAYQPDLVVIAFGTNDGFDAHVSPPAYAARLRDVIHRVRRWAPGVPILLFGAPDAETRNPALRANAELTPPATPGYDGWFSPPGLSDIRIAQRQVAAEEHVALWEWAASMGGPGATRTWASAQPPLQRGDHVHFTVQGGEVLAQRLQADLDQALRTHSASAH